MKVLNLVKKSAAVVLSAAVALGSLSLANIVTEGADVTLGEGTQTGNYISMPITLRDFAADGMLFDPNAAGESGTLQVTDNGSTVNLSTPSAKFRPSQASSINPYLMIESTNTADGGYISYQANFTSGSTFITFYMPSGLVRSNGRYLAIKYRTDGAQTSTPTIYHRGSGNYTNAVAVNFPTTGYNKSPTWTTAVIDMAGSDWSTTSSSTLSYVTLYPRLANGKHIDIAYAAFFSSQRG